MWLALSRAIYSRIAPFFALNRMFSSANMNGTLKQNNQSEKSQKNKRLKATVENFATIIAKTWSLFVCFYFRNNWRIYLITINQFQRKQYKSSTLSLWINIVKIHPVLQNSEWTNFRSWLVQLSPHLENIKYNDVEPLKSCRVPLTVILKGKNIHKTSCTRESFLKSIAELR